jgi:hypothetical protein
MSELDPWYRVAIPRDEVRQGRSFNPDEFAIHLEQVVARKGTDDYRDPAKFFLRNVFTRALKEHAGMVLQRLSGVTQNASPVLTLVTQFGGGKTHTLATLYHLATSGNAASEYSGVGDLLNAAGLSECPQAKVAAFVGNAWGPPAWARDTLAGYRLPTGRPRRDRDIGASRTAVCPRHGGFGPALRGGWWAGPNPL